MTGAQYTYGVQSHSSVQLQDPYSFHVPYIVLVEHFAVGKAKQNASHQSLHISEGATWPLHIAHAANILASGAMHIMHSRSASVLTERFGLQQLAAIPHAAMHFLQDATLHFLALTIQPCQCTTICKPHDVGQHLFKLLLGLNSEVGKFESKKSMSVLKFANNLAELDGGGSTSVGNVLDAGRLDTWHTWHT